MTSKFFAKMEIFGREKKGDDMALKGMQAFKPWRHIEGSSAPDFKS